MEVIVLLLFFHIHIQSSNRLQALVTWKFELSFERGQLDSLKRVFALGYFSSVRFNLVLLKFSSYNMEISEIFYFTQCMIIWPQPFQHRHDLWNCGRHMQSKRCSLGQKCCFPNCAEPCNCSRDFNNFKTEPQMQLSSYFN